MDSLFFADDGRLFGIYHCATGYPQGHGVVVCPPLFHEYYRSHYTIKRIATELARKGFDVLRFDYSGTGDSKGSIPDRPFETWSRDIGEAISALRKLGSYSNVSVVAARFSASLALPWQGEFRNFICWDSVLDSRLYFEQIDATNNATLAEHGSMSEKERWIHAQNDFLSTGVPRATIEQDLTRFTMRIVEDRMSSLPQYAVEVNSATDWVSAKLTQIYGHDVIKRVVAAL
jgi:hypothetical protein